MGNKSCRVPANVVGILHAEIEAEVTEWVVLRRITPEDLREDRVTVKQSRPLANESVDPGMKWDEGENAASILNQRPPLHPQLPTPRQPYRHRWMLVLETRGRTQIVHIALLE